RRRHLPRAEENAFAPRHHGRSGQQPCLTNRSKLVDAANERLLVERSDVAAGDDSVRVDEEGLRDPKTRYESATRPSSSTPVGKRVAHVRGVVASVRDRVLVQDAD